MVSCLLEVPCRLAETKPTARLTELWFVRHPATGPAREDAVYSTLLYYTGSIFRNCQWKSPSWDGKIGYFAHDETIYFSIYCSCNKQTDKQTTRQTDCWISYEALYIMTAPTKQNKCRTYGVKCVIYGVMFRISVVGRHILKRTATNLFVAAFFVRILHPKCQDLN